MHFIRQHYLEAFLNYMLKYLLTDRSHTKLDNVDI